MDFLVHFVDILYNNAENSMHLHSETWYLTIGFLKD